MDRRVSEAVRYLGYGKNAVDDRTRNLIALSFQELEQVAAVKSVYQFFSCIVEKEEEVRIGTMEVRSRNLAKNMKGCQDAAMFGITLGTGADLLIRKYMVTDIAKAVVTQACAAVLLEEACDDLQEKIKKEKAKEDLWIRPRFSPGYGDFDIHHQKDILRILDTHKKIGLSMTDSYMLTPTKSVTALIGICKEEMQCHKTGCESCTQLDCQYRRN